MICVDVHQATEATSPQDWQYKHAAFNIDLKKHESLLKEAQLVTDALDAQYHIPGSLVGPPAVFTLSRRSLFLRASVQERQNLGFMARLS